MNNNSENIFYKFLDQAINLLLLALCLIVFANVILRNFITSLTWTIEMSRILVVYFIFLGALVAYREKAHVNVDLIINLLSQRGKTICNAISTIMVFSALVILAIGSYQVIMLNRNVNFQVTNLPYSVLYGVEFVVVIGMMLMTVADFLKYLKNKFNG